MSDKDKIKFAINQISIVDFEGMPDEDAIQAIEYLTEVYNNLD